MSARLLSLQTKGAEMLGHFLRDRPDEQDPRKALEGVLIGAKDSGDGVVNAWVIAIEQKTWLSSGAQK